MDANELSKSNPEIASLIEFVKSGLSEIPVLAQFIDAFSAYEQTVQTNNIIDVLKTHGMQIEILLAMAKDSVRISSPSYPSDVMLTVQKAKDELNESKRRLYASYLTACCHTENENDTNDEIFDEKEFLSTIENELSQRLNNMQTFNDIPNISQRFMMSRQVKNFPIKPDITIRRDASYFNYILTLSAVDKPGLLYLISKELADNNIVLHSAKIATLGERAEDVFLISGTYLEDENFRIQLERKLIRVIS